MYRPRREDEVLNGRVALVGNDIQGEEVTIEAHEVWKWLVVGEKYTVLDCASSHVQPKHCAHKTDHVRDKRPATLQLVGVRVLVQLSVTVFPQQYSRCGAETAVLKFLHFFAWFCGSSRTNTANARGAAGEDQGSTNHHSTHSISLGPGSDF